MIRTLDAAHARDAVAVINAAAQWYASFLPPEEWQPPEMTVEQWHDEARRMRWFGAFEADALCAVMGLEPRLDAALIRHAYVAPAHQRQGIASHLLDHVEAQVRVPLRAHDQVLIGARDEAYVASGMEDRVEAQTGTLADANARARAQAQALANAEVPVRQLIAGTYAKNLPARALFERHGYRLSTDSESVLRRYYAIPEARLRTSVTLVKVI